MQFGFKQKLSTDMCIFTLKQIVDFYNMYNSPVYACFLDASKAFDKLNHWYLFSKLLDRGMPVLIVRILLYLYTHQKYTVRWVDCYSDFFYVSNGAPQGRILSPSFFNLYMDELSDKLTKSDYGCIINNVRMNHLFYADDTVVVASSPNGLQKLLDICSDYASTYELKFNAKKTHCMVMKPKCYKSLQTPSFSLSSQLLDFTDCVKYLGCYISNDSCDDKDISRLIRSVYSRGNILISRFRHCSLEVKSKLFKAYCTSFYGITTWSFYHTTVKNKLDVAYKKIFRAFFKYKREGTTSNMILNDVKPFSVTERHLLYGFMERLDICENILVSTIVNSLFYKSSRFFKHYRKLLYT